MDLLLASKSPRRRELLQQIGVRFDVLAVHVPELRNEYEDPEQYVQRLATQKARAGSVLRADVPVLGADTIVVINEQVLEKPRDKDDAVAMLQKLSDTTHQVYTAVALSHEHRHKTVLCRSDVTFRAIETAEAERYWLTGEPQDKAGGYGIQGFAAVFVANLQGSYSNVVGLPLLQTQQLLAQFDVPVWNTNLS